MQASQSRLSNPFTFFLFLALITQSFVESCGGLCLQVVNKLSKAHVHAIMQEYGVNYDRVWIYDKIHHEINQFCSRHTLQEVYIDKFDQVR